MTTRRRDGVTSTGLRTLARAEETFKVTHFPMGVCGAQAEREYVTLDPKNIACPSCWESEPQARSGSEKEPRPQHASLGRVHGPRVL